MEVFLSSCGKLKYNRPAVLHNFRKDMTGEQDKSTHLQKALITTTELFKIPTLSLLYFLYLPRRTESQGLRSVYYRWYIYLSKVSSYLSFAAVNIEDLPIADVCVCKLFDLAFNKHYS